MSADFFVCPDCGARSYNPSDIREGYCGNCHDFTGEQAGANRYIFNPERRTPGLLPELTDGYRSGTT